MGSRESAEISVVQCEMRYTRMLQRLCDPKCIQRIGEREHWVLTRRTKIFRAELDGLERPMSGLPFADQRRMSV